MNSNKNITNNNNPQNAPVKVIYFLNNKIISTKQFSLSSTFGSTLEYFQKNIKPQIKARLKKEYIYNNSKIDLNSPLMNFIELKKNSSSSTIESVEIYIELEESKESNIDQINNIPIFNILLQPKDNPFGIYVFKVKKGILYLEQYPEEIIKKFELNKFNINSSAFCNSQRNLYISGGIENNTPLKDFWIINNRKYSIIKNKMPCKKSNHSMLYIYLDNKEYIFIAGGDNNLMTFYYDLNMNSFIIWANMNSINIKPALYQWKQFIYSFNSFDNNGLYFERTNLITGKPNWEKINAKHDMNQLNILNFQTKNFAISNGSNEEIIFLGGEDSDPNILIYYPITNLLSGKNNNTFIKVKFSEKFLYNIDKEHNIALPADLSSKKEIVVFNKVKQTIRLINFEKYKGVGKINLKNDLDIKQDDNPGKIIVKTKIHERLRFEIQPEIVEVQKLTFEKKRDVIDENQIIHLEFIHETNQDDSLRKNNNAEKKKKNKFYLSDDVAYNNFVNLLVEKFKDKK